MYHPECLEHIQKAEGDWENPNRIISIMERIQGNHDNSGSPSIYPREIQISQEFERAKLDLLSRVHSTEYLNFVNELSKDLERQHKAQNDSNGGNSDDNCGTPPVVPFTPMVRSCFSYISNLLSVHFTYMLIIALFLCRLILSGTKVNDKSPRFQDKNW